MYPSRAQDRVQQHREGDVVPRPGSFLRATLNRQLFTYFDPASFSCFREEFFNVYCLINLFRQIILFQPCCAMNFVSLKLKDFCPNIFT